MWVLSNETSRRNLACVLTALLILGPPAVAVGQAEPPPDDAAVTGTSEARRHFELGVAHFDRGEWQAALVEFLKSRELAATKANTKNAAICLRKVGRFDEALDMFETLLRDFPDLPAADRELARREISELEASVGTLEIRDAPAGAHVTINGVDRGAIPLPGPVRVPAGSQTVRVVKDGSLPFEARVDVAGGQAKIVRVRLVALTQAGRLRVTEREGRSVEVVVDGAAVGSAPWEGALAPGMHGISLRGEGTLGAPPTQVVVKLNEKVALELVAVPLGSILRVDVQPKSAEIFVDGVVAGRGSWQGRLKSGTHRVVVTLPGYAPFTRTLTLAEGKREVVPVVLELAGTGRAGVRLELEAGVPLGLLWGGELESACNDACGSSLPFGGYVQVHAAYRFSSGIGLGIHAGYFSMQKTLEQRAESLKPMGLDFNLGTVDDKLQLAGLMAGAEADYVSGRRWPLTARLEIGALIGSVTDTRAGVFVDSTASSYELVATDSPRASYLYVGPELGIGHRLGDRFEVGLGAKVLVLAALTKPTWDAERMVLAGEDGAGYFPSKELSGGIMIALLPKIGVSYSF
jgi:PEGA domain